MHFDRRLLNLTRGERRAIALAALVGLAAVPLALWQVALTAALIARVFAGAGLALLGGTLAVIALLVLARAALQVLKHELAARVAARLKTRLRRRLYERVVQLGPGHFDQRRSGELVQDLADRVEQFDTFFGPYLPQLAIGALTPLLVFAFMARLDLQIALILLGFAVAALGVPLLFRRLDWRFAAFWHAMDTTLAADILDAVQGLPTLKAFGQSGARGRLLAERAWQLYRATMYVLSANIGTTHASTLVLGAGAALALAVGALRVQAGSLETTTLILVLLLGVEAYRPLRELVALYHRAMFELAACEGIFALLEVQPRVQDGGRASLPADAAPELRFEDVTFRYRADGPAALADLSFELRHGETLGVVGPSGAGKSTLVNLLLRFVEPRQGRVLLAGHDLRDLPAEQVRAQVAVVAQDAYLFHGSVADNLRMGKPDATPAELEAAARAANAHAFIAALPHGYETVVGERGVRLSGGERQRLAIARALLKDAPILVLDEATSSVDVVNEAAIREALARLRRGRTTLVIAHRLSSVVDADRILVLERGRLVEQGAHADLMRANGAYAALMASQAEIERERVRETAADEATAESPEPAADEREGAAAAPTEPTRRLPTSRLVQRLLGLVGSRWWELALVLLLGPLQSLALVAIGAVGALLVGRVAAGEPGGALVWLLLGLVPLASALAYADEWVAHELAFRLLAGMRLQAYRALDALAPGYTQRRRSGDLVSLVTGDVNTIESFFAHTISPVVVAVLTPALVLVVLALIAPPTLLALLPFLVIMALTPWVGTRAGERLGSQVRQATAELNAHLVDGVQGLAELIAFNRGAGRAQEVEGHSRHLNEVQVRFRRIQALQAGVIEALAGLGSLAALAVGASLVAAGRLERAELPLVLVLASAAFVPLNVLAGLRALQETLASARRYFAVQDAPVAVRDGAGGALPDGAAAVLRFESVTFAYDPAGRPALREVSFCVEPGQTVALVGQSGAGKTTAAHLGLRFWDPQQGRVTLGGHDLRAFALDDLRRHVALVSQDTYLFNTSLWDNLRLGRPDATDEQVREAARLANVDEFAQALPDGYETSVGERGLQLSGGQRQRIAIARALLKDAPVLVLDEATSHLDAVNEALVRQALARLAAGRTTLVIAHRLSTIRQADRIVILERGRVVAEGTPAELASRGGRHTRLIAPQPAGRD